MHGSARPRELFLSAALSAAAVALLHPSVPWHSPAASVADGYLRSPVAHAAPARPPAAEAFASYRAMARPPVPPPPRRPAPPRVSDDMVTAEPIPSPSPVPPPAPAPSPSPYPSYTPVPAQSTAYASPPPQAGSGGGSAFQACVIARESGGNPEAQNPDSTASGLYGFLDTTWTSVTGLPGPARDYSVAQQDAAFEELYAEAGTSPWAPSDGC